MQTLAPIPLSAAKLTLSVDKLQKLPIGIKMSERSGQAIVDILKDNDSIIVITATCDSLAREVTILSEELERYKYGEMLEEKPPDVITKKEPTGFQWFQIWIGRIAVALLVLLLIKRRLKII